MLNGSWVLVSFQNETAVFSLPNIVVSNDSSCDNTSSTLKLSFGEGHSWTMNFSKTGDTYQGDFITFVYNLNDSTVFPRALSNGDYKTLHFECLHIMIILIDARVWCRH